MHNDDEQLLNGETFDQQHRHEIEKFTGWPASYRGTNFDNFVKFVDDALFTTKQNIDEFYKAHDINYAHGLELDDIGDDINVLRNGEDDDIYRFFIKAKRMARVSNGTLNDLISTAANLLGCNPSEVYLAKDRHWDNGQLVGDPKTVKVVDIPYDKIKNLFTLDYLAKALEDAAVAGTKVKFISFSVKTQVSMYTNVINSMTREFDNATVSCHDSLTVPQMLHSYVYNNLSVDLGN